MKNVKKTIFSQKVGFCLDSSIASLLGNLLLITTAAVGYRRPLISPRKHLRKKIVCIPFERGESRDYASIKIFSITCKIAAHEVKQDR